jgi:hypothetical protein
VVKNLGWVVLDEVAVYEEGVGDGDRCCCFWTFGADGGSGCSEGVDGFDREA